jgi:putative spermidine/putrescine transport system substrate-binding protein
MPTPRRSAPRLSVPRWGLSVPRGLSVPGGLSVPRRDVLKLGTAAGAALGLAACGDGEGNPADEPLGGGEVVVGTWGGDYQDFQRQFVEPVLAGQDDPPTVVYDVGDQVQRMTKMRTEGESDGPGTLDVTELSELDMQEMINADLLAEIDTSRLGNGGDLLEALTHEFWVPHIYSANVIIYNTEEVTPAPDSYSVFWDERYAGRIGVLTIQWTNWYYAAAAEVAGGDPGNDLDAGWERMLELADRVRVYDSQEQLGQAMMSGEVWLNANWRARGYQWNEAGQAPLGTVVPQEGTFPIIFAVGIPRNAPNPDGAYAYIDAMLEAQAQQDFAENMGYSPTVTNTELPGELSEAIGFTAEEEELITPLDHEYYAENDPRWRQQYVEEFLNQ